MSDVASNNSVEANVDAKAFSDNTFNTGLLNTGDISPILSGKGVANTIEMLAIVRHPEKLAEWREANAEGVVLAYQKYREAMPWLNDQQALLLAMGTPATPEQAFNLFDILEKSANLLEGKETELHEPSASKTAKLLEGAKNSEEWARDKWAKLISGELETPGTFSKAAIAALDEMSFEDATIFEKLVSVCTGGTCGFVGKSYEVIPYKTQSGSLGGSNLTNDDMIRLASFGLVDTTHFKNGTVSENSGYALVISGELFVVKMKSTPGELKRGSCLLTPSGQELASLCMPGSHPGFSEFVRNDVERQGFTLEPVEAIMRAEGYETLQGQSLEYAESDVSGDIDERTASFIEGNISLADDDDVDSLF